MPSYYHFYASFGFRFILELLLENGNGDKVIYFVLNHIILIRKCFFTSAYFSPFDLKSSLNQKLFSLKTKVCFYD